MILNELAWIPAILILLYIPAVCYLDIKDREIPHKTWLLLAMVNIPVTTIMYLSGEYPLELLWLSLAFVVLYFCGMKLRLYEGADFMFLMFISLFFVVNPISGRVLMPLAFFEFFLAVMVSLGIVLMVIRHGKRYDDITGELLKFPLILPISAAFLLTLVLG